MIPDGNMLIPMKLDYSLLRCATVFTIGKLMEREWRVKNAKAYLKVHYLSGETIDDIKKFIEQCVGNKKDPKREERLLNIESQLNISNKPSSEIIVDYLLDSFGKKI